MTISFKVSKETIDKLNEFYIDLKREKTPPYAVFQADDGASVVTLYESGKIVFQGKDADLASQFWIETEKMNNKKLRQSITRHPSCRRCRYLYLHHLYQRRKYRSSRNHHRCRSRSRNPQNRSNRRYRNHHRHGRERSSSNDIYQRST
jgi:hypothetical protein